MSIVLYTFFKLFFLLKFYLIFLIFFYIIKTMFFEIFVQVLGFLAIALNIIAVQFNKYGTIIFFKTLGSLLFVVQYFLLGAYTGMVMDLIGSVRNIIFSLNVKNKRSNKVPVVIFSCITAIAGILTIAFTWDVSKIRWTDNVKFATALMVIISVLSIFAKLISTISYSIADPHKMRMLNIPSSSCWLVYNFVAFTLAGTLNEIMTLTSVFIAEFRFRKVKQQSKNTTFIKEENT